MRAVICFARMTHGFLEAQLPDRNYDWLIEKSIEGSFEQKFEQNFAQKTIFIF